MSGKPVMCAGTICAKAGQITQLRNDSGHYRPIDTSMVKAIQRLHSIGVNIQNIKVVKEQATDKLYGDRISRLLTTEKEFQAWKYKVWASAPQFLSINGNWNVIEASGTLKK
jgi:hypothetical protein